MTNIPFLLRRASRYTFEPRDTDVQLRLGSQGIKGMPKPKSDRCILVLTASCDREVSELSMSLAQHGVRLVRINYDENESRAINGIEETGHINVGNEWLKPALKWTRHHWLETRSDGSGNNHMAREYARQQHEALAEIFDESSCYQVNRGVNRISLLRQLKFAHEVGMRTPSYCVSRNPDQAAALIDSGDLLVVKALGSHWVKSGDGEYFGTFPKLVGRQQFANLDRQPFPIMFQEYIVGVAELRIYYIDGQIISYRVEGKRSAGDLWNKADMLRVNKVTIDSSLQDKLLKFAKNIGLDYGAIDMIITAHGDPVFLEVNTTGDWKYYETLANDDDVSCAVLAFLRCRSGL